MNGDRAAEMAFLLLALTLPLSALIARRMPIGETARLIGIWVVIILGTALVATVAKGGFASIEARFWPVPGAAGREIGS